MRAQSIKNVMKAIIVDQPEDASYEDIMKELSFQHMIARGLSDVSQNRMISHEEMELRIQKWQK